MSGRPWGRVRAIAATASFLSLTTAFLAGGEALAQGATDNQFEQQVQPQII